METVGAASGAAGLVSLGITICKGLLTYYSSWKYADQTVNNMYQSIEALTKTFIVLRRSISSSFLSEDAIQGVTSSIESCEQGISALDRKLAKIQLHTSQGSWKEISWSRMKGTLYPFRESTLVRLREVCHELRNNLSLAVTTLQIDASVISLEKLDVLEENISDLSRGMKSLLDNSALTLEHLNKISLQGQDDTLNRIYNWLSPLAGDFEQKQQEFYNTLERQDGMARQLFDTEEFKSWLNETGKIMWCTGMQGIGKSILTSLLIDTLQQATLNMNVGIAYVYCSYKESQKQTPKNLIASLLHQLLMQSPGTSNELLALYERYTKTRTQPIFSEYLQLLNHIIKGFSKVYIIIDGLDEYPEAKSMRSNFLTGVHNVKSDVCTFVTSRYLPSIEKELQGAVRLQLESNDEDIRKYLVQRLKKWTFLSNHLKNEPGLQETIIGNILIKAQRMFLLARLYVESLTRLITLRKVKAALSTLPEGLDKMYDDVMERIQAQDVEAATLAMSVIGWIYYAVRPLKLVELQHALAVEPDDTVFDEDGLADKDLLISVCGGLLSIQEGESVTFIHHTVHSYLDRQAPSFFIDFKAKIAQTCLTYLLFEELAQGASVNDEDFESRLDLYPFIQYASSYWAFHVRGQEKTQSVDFLTEKFLGNAGAISTAVQVKTVCSQETKIKYPGYSQDFSKYTPGLVFASMFGSLDIASTLLEQGANIEDEDSCGVRAIHAAIWEHHSSTAHLLLDYGADCDALLNSKTPPLHSATFMQGTPLHLAAIRGNDYVTKQLLVKKAKVNAQIENGWTPLHMAAANGHTSVMSLLIECGATVNATDGNNATAIYRAAENGQEFAIRMLLRHHGDTNIRTKLDQTPILRAAENGHWATVALLLEHGADWTIKDFLGWTPLYRALDQGHDSVATLLKRWEKEHRIP